MKKFREIFENKHVVLPVIHCVGVPQTKRNTQIAKDCGADGVFLINHNMFVETLFKILEITKIDGFWTGVNGLGCTPSDVMAYAVKSEVCPDGIWVDDAMIDGNSSTQEKASSVIETKERLGYEGLYFGGVAFKYQRRVDDYASASIVAAEYMDVITTSGVGTGYNPDVSKIKTMKEASPDSILAIASGMTPDNIKDYLPFADCFLVATGVSKDFHELDPNKLKTFVENVRG